MLKTYLKLDCTHPEINTMAQKQATPKPIFYRFKVTFDDLVFVDYCTPDPFKAEHLPGIFHDAMAQGDKHNAEPLLSIYAGPRHVGDFKLIRRG